MRYSVVNIGQHAGIHAGIPSLQLVVLLVDSRLAVAGPGDELLAKARRHFPTIPGMLVSIGENGFKAYAPFQTHVLLAYLQIPLIEWLDLDFDAEPHREDEELPF